MNYFLFFYFIFISLEYNTYKIGLLMNRNSIYDNEIIETIKTVIPENNIENNIKFVYINGFYDNYNECDTITNNLIQENEVNVIFMGLSYNCLLKIADIIKENNIYLFTTTHGLDNKCVGNIISKEPFIRSLFYVITPSLRNLIFVGYKDSYYIKIAKQVYYEYSLYNMFNITSYSFIDYDENMNDDDFLEEIGNCGSSGSLILYLNEEDLKHTFSIIKEKYPGLKLFCMFQECYKIFYNNDNIFNNQVLYTSYMKGESQEFDNLFPNFVTSSYIFDSYSLASIFKNAVYSTRFTSPKVIKPLLIGSHKIFNKYFTINEDNTYSNEINIYSFSKDESKKRSNMTHYTYINPMSISNLLPENYSEQHSTLYYCNYNEIISKPIHHILILYEYLPYTQLYADYLEGIFYEVININKNGGLLNNYIVAHFENITSINFTEKVYFI